MKCPFCTCSFDPEYPDAFEVHLFTCSPISPHRQFRLQLQHFDFDTEIYSSYEESSEDESSDDFYDVPLEQASPSALLIPSTSSVTWSEIDDTVYTIPEVEYYESHSDDDSEYYPIYCEESIFLQDLRIRSITHEVESNQSTSNVDDKDILHKSDAPRHLKKNRMLRNALRKFQFSSYDDIERNTNCPLCLRTFHMCNCKHDFNVQSFLSDFSDFFVGDSIPREYIKNLLIDASLLALQILNSKNKIGVCASIVTFCRARSNDFSDVSKFITLLSDHFFDEFPEFESQSDVEDFFSGAHDVMNTFESIQKLPIFKKLQKVILFSLSFSIFSKLGLSFDSIGYSRMESDNIRRKHKSHTHFVNSVLDLILYITEQGYMIYKYGDYSGVLHSSKTYGQFFDKVLKLKNQFPFLCNPEPSGFTESEFLGNLNSAREEGENLLRLFKARKDIFDDNDVKKLKFLLSDLENMWNQYHTKTAAAKTRKPPLAVLLYGESGVGKSSVKDMLAQHFCNVTGLPSGDEYRYVRNPASDFWDGFSTQQHTIILDDIAYLRPSACSDIDPTLKDLIQLINPTPFVPNQASLEDKGKTPCRPRLVIGTTNVIDLNANMYVSHATAIQRRMPYIIIPKVKKEYSKAGGALDTSKAPLFDGYPDLWTFQVKEVKSRHISRSHEGADIVTIPGCEELDLKDFLIWYNSIIFEHEDNQARMQQSTENMKQVTICKECHVPSYMCECLRMESALSDFGNFITGISLLLFLIRSLTYDLIFYTSIKKIINIFNPYNLWGKVKKTFSFKKLSAREEFCNIGSKAANVLSRPMFLAGLGSAICLGIGIVKFSQWTFNLQGAKQSKPIPHAFERENPWVKNPIPEKAREGTAQARCVGKQDIESVLRVFSKNMYKIFSEVGKEGQGYFGYITGMVGNKYVANNHTIPKGGFFMKLTKGSFHDSGVNSTRRFWVDESQIRRYPDRDLCILTLKSLPPVRDITPYLCSKDFESCGPGVLIGHMGSTMMEVEKSEVSTTLHSNLLPKLSKCWVSHVEQPTILGDCGKIYVHLGPQGPQIIGLHFAGKVNTHTTLATPLTNELDFSNHGPIQGTPLISAPSAQRNLIELHKKAPVSFIEEGTAEVFGSFDGFRSNMKSRVDESPIAPLLDPIEYPITHTKPDLQTWRPKNIALTKMVKKPENFQQDVIDLVKQSYLEDILSELPREQLDELHPFDDYTAINGAAGVAYVDSINRATSAGNPWKRSKKFFMNPGQPSDQAPNPVEYNQEIMDRIHIIEETLKKGYRSHPIFCAHLKDEPVTHAKAEVGKTRVFTGAPCDFSHVVRKYYLPLVRLLQNNKYAFEAAPGTVAQSVEWGDIHRYLTVFGEDRIVAGDFAGYDTKMYSSLMLAAFDILIELAKEGEYDEEDVNVMKGIAADTSFPLIDFFGDLLQLDGTNPSGHPLTVIINSLVNSLYMRYMYVYLNPEKEVSSFRKNVKLMTYGDDNIMGISPEISWYNHTTISQAFAKHGIEYTMADKLAESVPLSNIAESNFLKRNWRYEPDVGDYLCPLELASIAKSLTVWNYSKTVSEPEQGVDIISSAVREYFFHGRELFEEKSLMLKKVVSELKWDLYVKPSTFPSWEELCKQWLESSRKIKGQ